jgi:hypothetical protein
VKGGDALLDGFPFRRGSPGAGLGLRRSCLRQLECRIGDGIGARRAVSARAVAGGLVSIVTPSSAAIASERADGAGTVI